MPYLAMRTTPITGENLDRSAYIANLTTLRHSAPSLAEMPLTAFKLVCPHIGNMHRVRKELQAGGSVALPSVRVQGAYWQLSSLNGWLSLSAGRIVPPHEAHRATGRSLVVQSGGQPPIFLQDALSYGGRAWRQHLIADRSTAIGWFELYDPAQPNNGPLGGCKPVTAGCASFRVTFAHIAPMSPNERHKELNTTLVNHSVLPIERDELRGSNPRLFRHCAQCGYWLHADRCVICRMSFPPFQTAHTQGLTLPIPLIKAWLRRGRRFTHNPADWR